MGYKIDANSHFCGLVTVKDDDNLVMLHKEDWEKIGKIMGWHR